MPPRPFVNDALWRCLCPGFPANVSTSAIARISPARALRNRPREAHPARQSRTYSQSIASSPYSDDFFSQANAPSFGSRAALQPGVAKPDNRPPLAQLPTYILYEHLRDAGAKGHFDEALNICRVLVKDRGEAPNKEMYNGILHSFVSSSNGTAGKVRKVLDEMGFWADTHDTSNGQAKVELDARGCECVLEVLAVHPDYLLRCEILEYMKDRWFPLSPRGQSFVVAGMLRERNFEQALETLDDMVTKKIKIESWLFDKAMWILLEFGEVEEAFYVLGLKDGIQRKNNGMGSARLSSALWGALLDAAARTQLYDAASMVWTTRVQPGYLKPGTGACISVLAIAARHGDVDLATDVFRVLTERQTVFNTHHYELLIQTYLNADDLSAALSVILIMADSNIKVNAGTCIPLLSYLRKTNADESSRPLHAFNILQDFEASGRKVPTAAVNTCIQASIALDRFEEAIEIYKALHTVSHAGPDTQTFNILFQGCSKNARKELAMFFASEMIQLGLKPDRLTYDRLISVCLQSDNLEDALLYYEEMRSTPVKAGSSQMMQPRKRTWEALIMRCVDKGDDRAVATLKDYKQYEEAPKRYVEKIVMNRFEEGKANASPELGALHTGERDVGEQASDRLAPNSTSTDDAHKSAESGNSGMDDVMKPASEMQRSRR